MEDSMKVGILGSGVVGQALANGFIKHGHEVMVGTGSPEKLAEWKVKAGGSGQVASFAGAADFGDLIVLAVKGTAAKDVLESAGAENLGDKTVIDATNPIADAPPENGVLKFFTSLDRSLMEELQSAFPQARFVKAFSCVGNALMVNPDFGGIKPSMFICGNDEEAKREVGDILDLFGFEVEDMGGAEAARAIEPLCILWCIPGFQRNEWMHAFKLLRVAG
jgi:predicted dinucleotide-binding enzyme